MGKIFVGKGVDTGEKGIGVVMIEETVTDRNRYLRKQESGV